MMSAEFKGVKDGRHYDKVRVWANRHDSLRDCARISVLSGAERAYATAYVKPATARAIAAELIRLADELEGGE